MRQEEPAIETGAGILRRASNWLVAGLLWLACGGAACAQAPTADPSAAARAEQIRELSNAGNGYAEAGRRVESIVDEPGSKLRNRNRRLASAYAQCAASCWAQVEALRNHNDAGFKDAKAKFDYWHEEVTYLEENREPLHASRSAAGEGSTAGGASSPPPPPPLAATSTPRSSQPPPDSAFAALQQQARDLMRRLAEETPGHE